MKIRFQLWDLICREQDVSGGGGAATGTATTGGGGGTPATPTSLSQAAAAVDTSEAKADPGAADPAKAGATYHPEGLPDTLRGQSDKETIDKLFEAHGKFPRAPEKADDYKVELPPDFAKKYGDLSSEEDQKVLGLWRTVAHKNGLSQDQFQAAFVDLYGELENAGLIEMAPDFNAELEKLMPKTGDLKTRRVEAARSVKEAEAWIVGLATKGVLTKTEQVLLTANMDTAEGVQMVRKLMSLSSTPGLQGGGGGGGGDTKTDHQRSLEAMYPSMVKK